MLRVIAIAFAVTATCYIPGNAALAQSPAVVNPILSGFLFEPQCVGGKDELPGQLNVCDFPGTSNGGGRCLYTVHEIKSKYELYLQSTVVDHKRH